MLLSAGIGLGLLLAASVFFMVKGVGALLRRQWRGGGAVLGGLGLFALQLVLLAASAFLALPADADGPYEKSRHLAENISFLMNTSVCGAPLGLTLGIVVLLRNGRAARASRSTSG